MDEPQPLTDEWWRAYAFLVGAIAKQDATEPVDLDQVFRVADLVCGEPPDPEIHH